MAIEALTNKASVFQNNYTSEPVKPEVAPAAETTMGKQEKPENNYAEDTNEQGRMEVENAKEVSPEKVKKAVNEINQKIKPTHTSCQFSYHEETNRISIKVINDDTDEVIREIPPEKTLDMIAKTLELEGILVDEKR